MSHPKTEQTCSYGTVAPRGAAGPICTKCGHVKQHTDGDKCYRTNTVSAQAPAKSAPPPPLDEITGD